MRARYSIPAAGALLLLALVFAGAAHQVSAWHTVMVEDDVRFVTEPGAPRMWAAPRGPGVARTKDLLGLADDIRFRMAERLYIRGHQNATSFVQEKARLSARAADVDLLEETIAGDPASWRRARAANLLGILLFEDSRAGQEVSQDLSRQALRAFATGARENQGADDARFNLELLLTLLRPGGGLGRDLREDQHGTASGVGAGARRSQGRLLSVELETPWAALVALTAAVPVAAWALGARRSTSVRRTIGLGPPARRGGALVVGALALAITLLALAAAQPVVASPHRSTARQNADVFVVLDTSRSMLASRAPRTPTRFDRARAIARTLDHELPAAAVGIASITDRVLPHLFPTVNRADFDLTLDDAIGIQQPPPAEVARASGTDLGSLGELALAHFFPPGRHVRIAVVLTDGESRGFPVQPLATALQRARIQLVLIRLGNASERVFTPSGQTESYRPARGTGVEFARTALLLRASAYGESEAQAAITEVKGAATHGDGVARQSTTSVRELSLPFAVAALVPVLFLLWRRNVS